MEIIKVISNQFKENFKSIVLITILSSFLIISLVLLSYLTGISVMIFTRDPAAIAELPYYIGYFSQLGGVFWIASSSIAIFASLITTHRLKNFLMFSGLFCLFLALDDIFMIHDGLLPALNISGTVFFVIYAIIALLFFIGFLKTILKTPFLLLLLSFGSFALSVLNDVISTPGIHPYVFEDGFKMIGIISWMVYHYKVAANVLSIHSTENK